MENIVATLGVGLDTSAFSRPLGQISSNLRDFDKSLDASTARVLAFGASVGVLYTFQRAMIETVKSTVEIQKSLADINVIMNTTSKGLQNFGVSLFKVARDTGQSFKVVAEAAIELSRQGLGMQETLKRTRDALILTRLSGLDTVSSVDALTAAINSFSDSALTSTEIINKLANVDAAFAVSSRDLAESIRRVGSSAQDVGVNIDKLIALVTSAQQTTARGGAVIGNALKTIFTRVQRTDVLDQLEMVGVRVRDMSQNVLPATEILQSLALSYDKLGQSQRSQIAELVGGVYQINILKAAISDLSQENSVYAQALDKSRNATDQAIERNKELNKTYAAQINTMMVNFKQFGAMIGTYTMPPLMEMIVNDLNRRFADINSQDSEDAGAIIGRGIVKGLGEFLAGPGLFVAMYTLFKVIKSFAVDAAGAVRTMIGLNTVTIEQSEIQKLIFNALRAQPEVIGKIISGQMSSLQIQREILATTEATVRANALAINMTPATIGMLRSSNLMFDPKTRAFTKGAPPNFADYNRTIDRPIKEKIPNFTRFLHGTSEARIDNINKYGLNPDFLKGWRTFDNAFYRDVDDVRSISTYMFRGKSGWGRNIHRVAANRRGEKDDSNAAIIVADIPPEFVKKYGIQDKETPNSIMFTETIPSKFIKKILVLNPKIGRFFTKHKFPNFASSFQDSLNEAVEREIFSGVGLNDVKIGVDQRLVSADNPIGLGVYNKKDEPMGLNQGIARAYSEGKNPKNYGVPSFADRPDLTFTKPLVPSSFSQLVYAELDKYKESIKQGTFFTNSTISKYKEVIAVIDKLKITFSLTDDSTKYLQKVLISTANLYKERLKTSSQAGLLRAEEISKAQIPPTTFIPISQFYPLNPNLYSMAANLGNQFPQRKLLPERFGPIITPWPPTKANYPLSSYQYQYQGPTQSIAGTTFPFTPIPWQQPGLDLGPKGEPFKAYPSGPTEAVQLMAQGTSLKGSYIINKFARTGIGIQTPSPRPLTQDEYRNILKNLQIGREEFIPGTTAIPSLAVRSAIGQQEAAIIRDTMRRNQEKAAQEEEILRKNERLQRSKEKLAKQDEILNREATAENNRRIAREQEILAQQAQRRASNISELERKSLGIFGTGLGGGKYFKELKNISEESAADIKAKIGSRQMGVGLGISFLAPMMASTINETFIRNQDKESRVGRAMVSGVGDIFSYSGMGMLMGMPYTGIGVGITMSLMRIFQELNNNLPELEENAKKAGDALARFDDNILQITNILDTLRSAKSGEIDLSIEKQRQLFSDLASKSSNFSQDQRQNLREYIETGNIAKFQEFSGKLRRPKQIKKSINEFIKDLEIYNKARIPEEEEEFAEEFDAVISRFSDIIDLSGASLFSKLGKPDVLSKLKSVKQYKQYIEPAITSTVTIPGRIENIFNVQGLKDVLTMDLKGPEYEKERQKVYEEIDRVAQENPEKLQKIVNELVRQGEWINQKWEDYKKSIDDTENIDVLRRQMLYRISTKEAESNREFDLNATIRKNLADLSINRQTRAIERNKLFMPETGIFMLESGARRSEILDRFAQGKEGAFTQFKGGTTPIYQNLLEKSKSLGGIYEYSENIRQIQNLIGDIGMGTAKPQQLITHIESTIGFFEEFATMSEQNIIFPLLNQVTELTKDYINAQAKINHTKETQLKNEEGILVGLTEIANINKRLSFGGGLAQRMIESPVLSLYSAERMRTMGVSQLQRNQGLQTIMEEYQSRDFRPPESILIQYRRAAAQTRIDRGENPQKANILANEDVQNYLRNFSLDAPTVSLERLMQGFGFRGAARMTGGLFLEKRRTTAEKSGLELGGLQQLTLQDRELIVKYDREDLLNNREIQLISTNINKELNERLYLLGEISAEELRIANAENRQAKLQSGIYGLGDVGRAFTDQFGYNKRNLFIDLEKGAVDLGQTMKSSFKDAFKSFADGSRDAKDALRDLGLSVLNRLFERTIDIGSDLLFGGISAGLGSIFRRRSSGGPIEKFASGGFVSGGSGAVDDIPAMLSTGSYVLNKNAVNKYGVGFLSSLGVNGMANGGAAEILLKNAYLYNDPLRPSSGSLDISSNLSNYALGNEDNPQNIIRMEREQALYQYIKEKADYEARIAWELANFKRQKSQRIQAAYLSAGINIVGAGLISAFSGIGSSTKSVVGATGNIITPGKFTNVGMSLKPMLPTGGGTTVFNPNVSSFNTSTSFNTGMYYRYRANGGLINFNSSGGPTDNVPALLTGGEYVVNKNIVDKHGVNFFNRLNKGEINRFATGGFNGISSINPNIDNKSDLTDQLLKLIVVTENIRDSIFKTSKLTNAGTTNTTNQNVNLTPPVNNISITVNVQKNGQVDSKIESDNNRNANKDSDENNGRKLAEMIRTVTLDTIIKQQRNGGLLS